MTRKPDWKGLTPEQRKTQIVAIVNQAVKPVKVPEAKAAAVRNVWLRSLRADRELENAVANAPVLTAEYAFDRPDLATEPIGDVVPEGIRPPSLHTDARDLRAGPEPHEPRLHGQRFGIVVQRGSSGHVRALS